MSPSASFRFRFLFGMEQFFWVLFFFDLVFAQTLCNPTRIETPSGPFTALTTIDNLTFFREGNISTDSIREIQILNTSSKVWTTKTLPQDWYHLTAIPFNDLVVFRGSSTVGPDRNTSIIIYDTRTELFQQTNITIPGRSQGVALISNILIFAGGFESLYSSNIRFVFIHNQTIIKQSHRLITPRSSIATTTLNNIAYFAGGLYLGDGARYLDSVDIYDYAKDQWTNDTLSSPKSSVTATHTNDTIFFVGGYSPQPVILIDYWIQSTGMKDSFFLGRNLGTMIVVPIGNLIFFTNLTSFMGIFDPLTKLVSDPKIDLRIKYGTNMQNSVLFFDDSVILYDICCAPGFESVNGFCKPCSEGYFSDAELSTVCMPCLPGTSPSKDSTSCIRCEAGFFSRNGTRCVQCPEGHFSNAEQSTVCKPCSLGTSPSNDSTRCDRCEAGFFSRNGTKCVQCPNGSYSSKEEFQCTTCSAGTASSKDWKRCDPCPDGHFCLDGIAQICPKGKIASKDQLKCDDCENGRFCPDGINSHKCGTGTKSSHDSISCEPDLVTILPSLFGSILVVLVIVVIVIFVLKRRKTKKEKMIELTGVRTKPNIDTKLELKNIEVKHKLGEGNFGEVYYGLWDGTPVALKKINEEEYGGIEKEALILSELSHVSYLNRYEKIDFLAKHRCFQRISYCREPEDVHCH